MTDIKTEPAADDSTHEVETREAKYPVEPAEVVAEDPESLYTGRPNYWARRQQQSGMERKHELWVMETLNFLQHLDIPFYTRDERGDRIPQKDKEIPERLKMALEKFWEQAKELRGERDLRWEKEKQLRTVRAEKKNLADALLTILDGQNAHAENTYHDNAHHPSCALQDCDCLNRFIRKTLGIKEEDDGKSQPV